eukprot:CAMPEP_0184693096 /NCGR_PEP_ID=MMETSP0313-20130426/1391_1 /TAXON_ID=2792 /ORGANISM="Porphyridium aerugineum, Strain SAG 1380-2" /LENGTH=525 /DNA_ID=CAMNT_0027151065 /DNA_START=408 /DNA_END=1985 /DNA_ORIENTATION=+
MNDSIADVPSDDREDDDMRSNGILLDDGVQSTSVPKPSAVPRTLAKPLKIESLSKTFASVCKVFTWKSDPNFSQPWQMKRQRQGTGSAFAIAGRRLLTNAHVVANATQVLVRPHGSSKRYIAKVSACAHDSDLALLTIEEDEFWTNIEPLELRDEAPQLQESVSVIGYPIGGNSLSITSGVVSRVDIHSYTHSGSRLLCVQIDAAINGGNSGGAAVQEGKVVGVPFQGRNDAENIGYIVPCAVIRRFLRDLEVHKGEYRGMPELGISYQRMENEYMRKFTGLEDLKPEQLPPGVTAAGIYICEVDPLRASPSFLLPGDVLLAMDHNDIGQDACVAFRDMERVNLLHALTDKLVDDPVTLTILRNKQVIQNTVTLTKSDPLVPVVLYDIKPRYLIFGGLVFVPLTCDYLRSEFGSKYMEKAPPSLLTPIRRFKGFEDEEVVVLSQVLACEVSVGYEFRRQILLSINNIPIRNLKHLGQVLDECNDPFLEFQLLWGITIVLEKKSAMQNMESLLKEQSISSDRSIEL